MHRVQILVLLNGLPAMLGVTFVQVTLLNIFAIWLEFRILGHRLKINKLLLRCILSNLVSLIAGLIVFFIVPDLLHGMVFTPDDYHMTRYDIFTMYCGLTAMFLVNVLLEIPAYFLWNKDARGSSANIIKTVLIANIASNIPVFILYGISV